MELVPNNNLSVLPWYTNQKYQDFRKSYAYGEVYPLFSPDDALIPFQIVVPKKATALDVSTVELYDTRGNLLRDITSEIVPYISIREYEDPAVWNIVYNGAYRFSKKLTEGQYYARMVTSYGDRYSEVFTVVANAADRLTIEWWNDENLYYEGGLVDYTPPYLNRVYLCSQLGKPEYEYEEEGDERDGYFFPELQLSEKRYRFQFLAPEYLCDALRIAQVSDHVRVSASGLLYDCDQITISVNWQTQGNIASVEVEFECATVVKNIGVSAPLKSGAGDYKDDYNNDYNNE